MAHNVLGLDDVETLDTFASELLSVSRTDHSWV